MTITDSILHPIHRFCQAVSHGLSKPQQKFFLDMILGILKAGSVILARIADQLEEARDLRYPYKRLDYPLDSDRWDEIL